MTAGKLFVEYGLIVSNLAMLLAPAWMPLFQLMPYQNQIFLGLTTAIGLFGVWHEWAGVQTARKDLQECNNHGNCSGSTLLLGRIVQVAFRQRLYWMRKHLLITVTRWLGIASMWVLIMYHGPGKVPMHWVAVFMTAQVLLPLAASFATNASRGGAWYLKQKLEREKQPLEEPTATPKRRVSTMRHAMVLRSGSKRECE
jgi:hypothetical protein